MSISDDWMTTCLRLTSTTDRHDGHCLNREYRYRTGSPIQREYSATTTTTTAYCTALPVCIDRPREASSATEQRTDQEGCCDTMAWSARVQNGVVSQAYRLRDHLNITDNMPSIRTASRVALSGLAAAQHVLGFMQSPVDRRYSLGASATCNSPQLSCQNTTAQPNLCCFNAPGGALLQTQFWDTNPVVGPSDSWTIHGLWPDNCDGTYEASCDDKRAYTNITQILNAAGKQDLVDYMSTYWQSNSGSAETFWEHG